MREWIVIVAIMWLCVLALAYTAPTPTRVSTMRLGGCMREGFVAGASAPAPSETSTSDDGELKCIVVKEGTPRICVRSARGARVPEAAQLLAANRARIEQLNVYLRAHYEHVPEVQLYLSRVDPNAIEENLPTSEYTAVTTNKGEKIQFDLSPISKADLTTLIDPHTLFYVTLHELGHVMDSQPDHSDHFWQCFAFLLRVAKEAGLHEPVDYSVHPRKYAGDTIQSNPYFTLHGGTIGRDGDGNRDNGAVHAHGI